MEKKEAPLVNGESLTPDGSPERQPCLPPPPPSPPSNNPASAPVLEAGRRKLSSGANSVSKGLDKGDFAARGGMRARVEDRLRRRTGLSRVGLLTACFLLCMLLVFLIVVIVLAVSWPQTPHEHEYPVCTRAACLKASAQMLPKMDLTEDPCDDFWHHACRGWLKSSQLPPTRSYWSLLEEQRFRYREGMRNFVTTLPFPDDSATVEWKLQYMYESCMRLDSIEQDGTRPLAKLLNELGGWNVLPDFSSFAWNSERSFVKIFAAQSITPFFHVDVVPDPKNASRNIIKIIPSGLDLPDKSYYYRTPDTSVPAAYMQYLKDIVGSFDAKGTIAKRFSDEMFYYQRRIAEFVPDRDELSDPVASNHRATIESLKLTAALIPLLDILHLMFPRAAINKDTEVLVPASMYLSKISSILSTSDKSTLNNYLMWIFASSYIPYLNKEIREIENTYKRVLTGAEKPVERWEMCITTLEKHMGLVLTALMEKKISYLEKTDTAEQVNVMFDNIRDSVRSSVLEANWFDKEIQELALQKLNTMTLQIGIHSSLLTEEYLTRYYEGLRIQRSDFFKNIRNAREFELSNLDKKLMEPLEELDWLEIATTGDKVTYVPSANKVVVPQWLLSAPFYDPYYPAPVQYGGLGVQIAHAIVLGVLPPNILFDANGELMGENSTVFSQSAGSVRRAKAFVIRDVVQNGLANHIIANRTALNTVTHVSAVRQAHSALKKALLDQPHVHQPAMETFESEHLFFLTCAQNMCSKSTPRQMDIDFTTSQHLNGSQLLPAMLKQLPEFSEVFGCPTTSVHYASNPSPDIL